MRRGVGGEIPENPPPPRPAIQHPVIEARKCLSFSASGTWLINYKLACALKSAKTSPHYFTNGCQLCRDGGGGVLQNQTEMQLGSLGGSSLSSFDRFSAAFLSAYTLPSHRDTHPHWKRLEILWWNTAYWKMCGANSAGCLGGPCDPPMTARLVSNTNAKIRSRDVCCCCC